MSEHEQMTEHHIPDNGPVTVRQICANCCTVSKDEYGHLTIHRDADWPCPSMQLAAQTARIKALEAAGEGILELLTDHSHGVALSPPSITQAFGDWLAALSLDYVYVEPVAGPDDAQAGGEVDA